MLPGPTASEGVTEFIGALAKENGLDNAAMEKEFFKSGRPTSLLKRFITSEEIANVVAFVCSPLAASINGSAVRAEGGILQAIA